MSSKVIATLAPGGSDARVKEDEKGSDKKGESADKKGDHESDKKAENGGNILGMVSSRISSFRASVLI